MKQKALIVESTRLFQNVIEQIMSISGVECHTYTSGKDALEASHDEYTFIMVARTLEDLSAEVFLQRYAVQHGVGDALTIMMTSSGVDNVQLEANKAGFKLVFDRNNMQSLQEIIIKILNTRTLELEANILLVEDTKSIADLTVRLFEKNNTTIDHVSRLDEMKIAFVESNYELVITDYYLHDNETGDDVIFFIRNHDDANRAKTPILVVSGETNQKKRTSFLRNGADDFIIKPYDDDELLVRTSNLIKNFRLLKHSKKQQQALKKLALTDHLTGLYNRHSLYDLGPRYLSNAIRHKTPLSLLVIDLDHFKNINDTYGHSTGDKVLETVANVLSSDCRTEDIVARFGGEEFIMVLTNCNLENALKKAENLRIKIEACQAENLLVTASIGVAEFDHENNFDSLFDRADKAVYQAKENGRNKVVAASEE